MELSGIKKEFVRISILFAIALIITALLLIQFYDSADYIWYWMIFVVVNLVLTVGYFQLLQIRIRKIPYPPIVNLASICFMVGLALGIVALLIIQQYMWTIFTSFNIVVTIWTGKQLWLKNESS